MPSSKRGTWLIFYPWFNFFKRSIFIISLVARRSSRIKSLKMPFALRSVKQPFSSPAPQLLELMYEFRSMVNNCIRIGLETNVSSLKGLSLLTYSAMKQKYPYVPSYYRLTSISKAAGILSSRKKSQRRGGSVRDSYLKKPLLVSCYTSGSKVHFLCFRISKKDKIVRIPLTSHTVQTIEKRGIE